MRNLELTNRKAFAIIEYMSSEIETPPAAASRHPICQLSKEDLDLAAELLLKSGSLKDLAATYGVSYPTIRTRVDRVIERFKAIMAGKPPDPLTDLLANLVDRGEMSAATARLVRDAAREMARSGAAAPAHASSTPPPPEVPTEPAPSRRFDWKPRYS